MFFQLPGLCNSRLTGHCQNQTLREDLWLHGPLEKVSKQSWLEAVTKSWIKRAPSSLIPAFNSCPHPVCDHPLPSDGRGTRRRIVRRPLEFARLDWPAGYSQNQNRPMAISSPEGRIKNTKRFPIRVHPFRFASLCLCCSIQDRWEGRSVRCEASGQELLLFVLGIIRTVKQPVVLGRQQQGIGHSRDVMSLIGG